MEYSSKKYLILLAVICIVFVFFIAKAFDYLPDKSVENHYSAINTQMQENVNTIDNNQQPVQQEENYDTNRHKSGHIDFMPKPERERKYRNTHEFEEINAPRGTYEEQVPVVNNNSISESPEERAIKSLLKANRFKLDRNYDDAIAELQNISAITNDNELLAISYEKIAELYATLRRYDTALSFAEKANATFPSVNREMLIARIYYQSGDTENAVTRMNGLLRRGFKN